MQGERTVAPGDASPQGIAGDTDRAPPAGPGKATIGLFVVAVFVVLYVARQILLPITLALLLSLLLMPVMRVLLRAGSPRSLAAGVVVLGLVAIVGTGFAALVEPADTWLRKTPDIANELATKLYPVRQKLEEVVQAAKQVEEMASTGSDGSPLVVDQRSVSGILFANAGSLLYGSVVMVFMLYFLLATQERVMRKLHKLLSTREERSHVIDALRTIEHEVSRYLVTMALINVMLGATTGLMLWAIGLPNPVLWGVVAGLLNFVPYIGPVVTLVIVTAVSLLTFDSLGWVLLAPGLFLIMTGLEGQLITPLILGQRLALNPLVVFTSIVFWGWLWGALGALMAVPIAVTLKIVFDRLPGTAAVGELMGR